jgi:amidohydrolase
LSILAKVQAMNFKVIDGLVKKNLGQLVEIRRWIHQHPESAYEEVATAALVERELRACEGVQVARIGKTGVLGTLKCAGKGKTVALRADMDALKLTERTGLPYASNNGCMHACGHDGNTTSLIGAARVLSAIRGQLRGSVRFIFQPAEEGGGGARTMVAGGAMEGVDAIFAQHGFPDHNVGCIGVSTGMVMAACDNMHFNVQGRGCHGAQPNRSVDPVVMSAHLITALQTIVSRGMSPTVPAVVTIGMIHGGTAVNIIPDSVQLAGTLRCVDEESRRHMHASVRRIAAGTAKTFGGKITVRIDEGYPATINDEAAAEVVRQVGGKVLGKGCVGKQEPSMGAEDFSFYLQHTPGCMFQVGQSEPGRKIMPLHSTGFDYNDKALPTGVKMFCGVAMEWLGQPPAAGGGVRCVGGEG